LPRIIYFRQITWLLAALLLWPLGPRAPAKPKSRWQVNVIEKFGFEPFSRGISRNWYQQQGVVFLSAEKILIYQVRQRQDIAPLSRRDASGGGGNFFVQLEVLDAKDGHEVRNLRLPTNVMANRVLPLRQGRFLVETGDVLYLYSEDFRRLASKELPSRPGESDWWEMDVSPSGKVLVLARSSLEDLFPMKKSGRPIDVEILNADTLQKIGSFAVDRLPVWSTSEDAIICADPLGRQEIGFLDHSGNWKPITTHKTALRGLQGIRVLAHRRVAFFGPTILEIIYGSGSPVVARYNVGYLNAVRNADDFLATHVVEGPPIFASLYLRKDASLPAVGPSEIELYNLDTRQVVTKLSFLESVSSFDVSTQGDVAVIHGSQLEVFHAPELH
jgi:hypothetical protein